MAALSVDEIAYRLGFKHPQSFSKLFKNKTQVSPLEFRKSFHLKPPANCCKRGIVYFGSRNLENGMEAVEKL